MKKFLIFLVSIIVVVCFGLTTYYFLRNDEVVSKLFSTLAERYKDELEKALPEVDLILEIKTF